MLFSILLIIRLCKANNSYSSLNFAGDVLDGKSISLTSNPNDSENMFSQLTTELFDGGQSNFLIHSNDSKLTDEGASSKTKKDENSKKGKKPNKLKEENGDDGESSEKTTTNAVKLSAENEANNEDDEDDN